MAPAQAEPPIASPIEAQPSSPPEDSTRPPAPTLTEQAEPRPQAARIEVSPELTAIVDAMDRYESDRDLDASRHPGELLAFLGLAPGMHVAELFAGKGYTTELLARRVGRTGRVWAENPPALLKIVGKQFADRMAKPVMQNVIRVDQAADAPLPPEAKDLDAVVCVLAYHDAVWQGVDRNAMNKAVFDALRSGGEYVIVDHSAATGHGTDDVKTLHRIDEAIVLHEVESAGFRHAESAGFLRNPDDARDWNDSPSAAGDKRGTSDRFVLTFVRP